MDLTDTDFFDVDSCHMRIGNKKYYIAVQNGPISSFIRGYPQKYEHATGNSHISERIPKDPKSKSLIKAQVHSAKHWMIYK